MPDSQSSGQFIIHLGSFPKVSVAEIKSLSIILGNTLEIIDTNFSDRFCLVRASNDQDLINVFLRSGGIPKIAKIVATLPINAEPASVAAQIANRILEIPAIDRVIVGISIIGLTGRHAITFKKKMLNQLKQTLKAKNIKLHYPGKPTEPILNTATITKRILNKQGYDFDIIVKPSQTIIDQTIQVQSPDYWQNIDINKPERDMIIGMLPSKLARIMINLAQVKAKESIWDPFTGLGTIIMQSQLLNLYGFGSDISSQLMVRTEKNLAWLQQQGMIADPKYRFFKYDITEDPYSSRILKDIGKSGKFDAIVCEPYLGPALKIKDIFDSNKIKQIWIDILPLYDGLIRHSYKMLKTGGILVYIQPQYLTQIAHGLRKWYNPQVKINNNHWQKIDFGLGDLEWKKPDSIVAREIIVLRKK